MKGNSSALASSFEFHKRLEPFSSFVAREKLPLAFFGGTFTLIMLAALFIPDASFFYSRVETDQLLYLLKAKAFVETGSAATARSAINSNPFPYAAMPGLIRSPFMMLFNEFDYQLRGMQLMNVAFGILVGTMSAYILSWSLPERLHRWGVAFAFGFMICSPDWLTNMFVPMADLPYATFTLACVLIAASVFAGEKPLSSRIPLLVTWVVLFGIAFGVRYTAPVLFIYAAALLRQRWRGRTVPRWLLVAMVVIPVILLAGLIALNSTAIFGRYLREPVSFFFVSDKKGMILNLIGASVPAQIVPGFLLGFQVRPLSSKMDPVFATTPRDAVWVAFGVIVTAIVVYGAVKAWRRQLPEILYVLAPLPVLALMIPSTARYLMSYEPFIWAWFVVGLAALTRGARARFSWRPSRTITVLALAAAAAAVVYMRTAKTARTSGGSVSMSAVAKASVYLRDVGDTHRQLREFLESLPQNKAVLLGSPGTQGRWKLIANRDYYKVDPALPEVLERRDVYLVLSCATASQCGDLPGLEKIVKRRINRFGSFEFTPAFERTTANSAALVFRLTRKNPG